MVSLLVFNLVIHCHVLSIVPNSMSSQHEYCREWSTNSSRIRFQKTHNPRALFHSENEVPTDTMDGSTLGTTRAAGGWIQTEADMIAGITEEHSI